MPQENDNASQLNHREEILRVVFVARDGASKVLEPGEEPFNFPASSVPTENTQVLRLYLFVDAVGCNQFDVLFVSQTGVERIVVISFVPDHSLGFGVDEFLSKGLFNEGAFMRRS